MRLAPARVVSLVEAAYDLERPPDDWLDGVVAASIELFGGGAAGYFVDASQSGRFTTWGYRATEGGPPKASFDALERGTPYAVKAHIHMHAPWNFGTQIPKPADPTYAAALERTWETHRIAEFIGLNALDATRRGCAIAIARHTAVRTRVSAARRALVARLVAHIATGARLLAKVHGSDARAPVDAVVSPRGRIEHAEGLAKDSRAREALREAAIGIDRARTRGARLGEEEVTDLWQALVDGRWTLVDHFERGGRRYYVARNNEVVADGDADAPLTSREAVVARAAALGHANKLIAYELGISASTVATLLRRAAQKLGASSRVKFVRVLRERALA